MSETQEQRVLTLLEQRDQLNAATAIRIKELLAYRIKIDKNRDHDHFEVTAELKALGYKRPRKVQAK